MIRYILLALLSLSVYNTYGCNACGCGVSAGYVGGGHQSGTYAGIAYAYRAFHTRPSSGASSQESFQRMDLKVGWQWNKWSQVRVNIPYMYTQQSTGEEQIMNSGLGDVSTMLFFSLTSLLNSELPYSIYLGGGVKMPTGEYLAIQNGLWLNPNLQVGRGSWDFPLYASLERNWDAINLALDLGYTINGENRLNYRFGNQLQSTLRVYKNLSQNSLSKIIDVGGFVEHYGYNREKGTEIFETQGSLMGGQGGFSLESERFRLGAFAKFPIWQSLFQGQVQSKPAVQINLSVRLLK
ncbi:hypothetical protein QWY31_07880 [Cytophagales bacterium LB-30]|uniref:Transporter n=1 Tax=Shiella aurantiaca TaxID=3058365 RepID=A0ABT8F5B8_9BACT|nr:hypothetical protein [Shiella aurantiaca]MDN4165416.1 hypothetical protein [Shiella aurantiaca]